MDHDDHVNRLVEGRSAAIERGVVEVPFGRSDLPDHLGKLAPIFLVTGPVAPITRRYAPADKNSQVSQKPIETPESLPSPQFPVPFDTISRSRHQPAEETAPR